MFVLYFRFHLCYVFICYHLYTFEVHKLLIESHPSFETVSRCVLPFLTKDAQMAGGRIKKMTLGTAIKDGIIGNETLGYFLGRIFLFASKIGIHQDKMRFRQHMGNVQISTRIYLV